jgi:hypothetical protein
MAKSPVDAVTDEKIAKGGVLIKFYFDMQHKDKDKLQPLMVDLINERLMKEIGVVYAFGAIEEAMEFKGVYSTSAVVTVLFENFFAAVAVALNYSPAGLEIIKPSKEMHFKTGELQSLLMSLSQRAADYSRYVFEKVLSPDEMEEINRSLENRERIGKNLLEKTKKGEEEEKKD